MEDIHRIIEAMQATNFNCVLATIIQVEGSAYRKEGTTMLFQEDGTQVGTLSGGCLEADLALRAADILKGGYKRMFVFDMRSEDDLSWGQGPGCNGLIYVLLEPIDQQRRADLFTLQSYLNQRESVMLVQKLTEDLQGLEYMYLPLNGEGFGSWSGDFPDKLKIQLLDIQPNQRISGIKRIVESEAPMYIHFYRPKPRLIIFGAGPDAKPLVAFARKTGFTVTLADWREALCNINHFPDADQFIIGFPVDLIRKLSFSQDDFIVLMTHQFQRDQELLSYLQDQKLRYIGLLGSRQRLNQLLGAQDRASSIHSPIGVPIGAEGPEEIAISILAEVIGTLRMNL